MKYISLFEKFESLKLSKILRYISNQSKKEFISDLDVLAKCEDIQLSKISDDMFTYLPYKNAIKLQSKREKKECPTCSGTGKVKRPWGTEGKKGFHYRSVNCGQCSGTGELKQVLGKITDIKFWFNIEGKYLGKSCINGTSITNFDRAFDLFPQVKQLTHEEVQSLENGTKIKVNIQGVTVISTIVKGESGIPYAIQNRKHSTYPNNPIWKKYGSYSWPLSQPNYYSNAILLKETDEENPNFWNLDVIFDTYSKKIITNQNTVKNITQDAEFCLVLNLDKFLTLKKIPRSEISQKRKNLIGTKKSNDEIRNENISRYINKLSQTYTISKEISDVSKIMPRLFGWDYSFLFVLSGTNFSSLISIIDIYFSIFRTEMNEEEIKPYEEDIRYYLKNAYSKTSSIIQKLEPIMKDLESKLKGNNLEFIKLLKKLGSVINEKILKGKIETISDMENIEYKIQNISSMIISRRYNIRNIDSYIKRIATEPENLIYAMNHYPDIITKSIDDLKHIISSVNRM